MSHVTCQLLQLQHIQTFVWLVCGYFPFFKPLLQWKFAYRNGLLLLWLSSMNEAGTFCHNHRRHLDKWHARLLRVALSNSTWGLGFVKFWYFGTCFTFFFWVLGCSLLVVSSTNSLGNTPCISTKNPLWTYLWLWRSVILKVKDELHRILIWLFLIQILSCYNQAVTEYRSLEQATEFKSFFSKFSLWSNHIY